MTMDSILIQARKQVMSMKKDNPNWRFTYIVGKVANWHNVDYHELMCSFRRKKQEPKPKKKKIDKSPFPEGAPWWVKY